MLFNSSSFCFFSWMTFLSNGDNKRHINSYFFSFMTFMTFSYHIIYYSKIKFQILLLVLHYKNNYFFQYYHERSLLLHHPQYTTFLFLRKDLFQKVASLLLYHQDEERCVLAQ